MARDGHARYNLYKHISYKLFHIRFIWCIRYGPLHIIKILNNPNHGLRLSGNWGVSFVSFWKVESRFHIFWFSLYWQRNAKWYIGGLGMIPFLAHSVIKCIIRRTQIEISHSNSASSEMILARHNSPSDVFDLFTPLIHCI